MNLENSDACDYLFKIVMIGDAGVGKTCIVQRFKTGIWLESQSSTIGVDFCLKTCDINGKRVKLQVWDTAGQERFRTITQSYYRSAHAVLCAFDITQKSTFHNINHWMEDVLKFCAADVIKVVIGNKCDLSQKREVPQEAAYSLSLRHDALEYVETSAKDNKNIDSVFRKIAEELLKKYDGAKFNSENDGMALDPEMRTKSVDKRCCVIL